MALFREPVSSAASELLFLAVAQGTVYVADELRVLAASDNHLQTVVRMQPGAGRVVGVTAAGTAAYWLSQDERGLALYRYEVQTLVELARGEPEPVRGLTVQGGRAYWLGSSRVRSAVLEVGSPVQTWMQLPRQAAALAVEAGKLAVYYPSDELLELYSLALPSEHDSVSLRPSIASAPSPSVHSPVDELERALAAARDPKLGECGAAPAGLLGAAQGYFYGVGTRLWRTPAAAPRQVEQLAPECLTDARVLVADGRAVFIARPGSPDSMRRSPSVLRYELATRRLAPFFGDLRLGDLAIDGGSLYVLGFRRDSESGQEVAEVRVLSSPEPQGISE